MSCDLLQSETEGHHYQGDVRDVMYAVESTPEGLRPFWDLMIAHPPCTHLAVSGAAWFKEKRESGVQQEALDFVQMLMDAPIARICIENPISIISTQIRKPDQIIQPWMFGHDASKKTCLWLKNLPLLAATQMVEPRIVNGRSRWGNQTASGQNKLAPSADRWKIRSETYKGIADAMASQWGI
jgi:hypothetical protein